jgi:hypothetical protein
MARRGRRRYAVLTVTRTEQYVLPLVGGGDRTEVNGWTVDEVTRDWFENEKWPAYASHASRDTYRLGYSERFGEVVREPDVEGPTEGIWNPSA